MSSRFVLVRHGTCALTPEVLLGRALDAPLDPVGRAQAQAAADRLRECQVRRVDASPRLRTRQTAATIAAACGVRVQVATALDELDFGDWAGRRFADLDADPRWQAWNSDRDSATTPASDSMAAVRARALAWLQAQVPVPAATIQVVVTHAEVIRALLLPALGLPFSAWSRLEIAPGSCTWVRLRGERLLPEASEPAAA
jgi:broad specificity phosphatase PhoE